MRLTLLILFFGFWIRTNAQVTADFDFPTQICSEQQFELENTSFNASSYEWFFCASDYADSSPAYSQVSNNSSLVFTYGIETYKFNGGLYALGARNAGILYNFEFDPSFSAITNVNTYNVPSSAFSLPRDIGLVNIDNKYYGYVSNSANLGVTKLEFGDSPLNDPTVSHIDLSGDLLNTNGIELIKDTSLYLFVGKNNSNRIYRLRYDTLDLNMPEISFFDIIGLNNITGISVKKLGSKWYGLASSESSNAVVLLNYGSSLSNAPIVTSLNYSATISVSRVLLEIDQNQAYGFIQSKNGTIVKLSFDDVETASFNEDIISLYSGSAVFPIGSLELEGNRFIYHVDLPSGSRKFNKFSFLSSCSGNINSSNELNPVISYAADGIYQVQLSAFNNVGQISTTTKSITVTTDVAPELNIAASSLENCINATVSFSGSSPQTITSWSWNFGNGDTSTDQNPDYTFNLPGTYEVTVLAEGANGCSNQQTQTVEIYEPPTASFNQSTQGSICSRKPVQFTNTSTLPTSANFTWNFGDGNSSAAENPEHVFETAGTYQVVLTIDMAGCNATVSQEVIVSPGPAISFENTNNCFGQLISFSNNSTGDFINSYKWNFGDGTTSTQENPAHRYDTPGTKLIQLTALTSNGCDFTLTKSIEVYPLAEVDFSTQPACSGTSLQFTEEVSLTTGNVASYLWDFGVTGSSTDISNLENPNFTYTSSGQYNVKLQVTTDDGCISEKEKTITVAESPQPQITYNAACLGQPFTFSGNAEASTVNQLWQIFNAEGTELATASEKSIEYTFANAGIYTIKYRQETDQLCSNTVEENITISPPPLADFTAQNLCLGTSTIFGNNSNLNGNEVSNYNWLVDGELISNEANTTYIFTESGTYEVILQIESRAGCTVSKSETITISDVPQPDFTLPSPIVAAPYELNLTSPLTTGESANWYVNNKLVETAAELSTTIDSAGTYFIGLELINNAGCRTILNKQLSVRQPTLNISISNLQATDTDDFKEFVITLSNKGSLVPDYYNLTINFGEFSVTERVDVEVLPETLKNKRLSVQLSSAQLKGIDKVCIEAEAIKGAFQETTLADNRSCISLTSGFKVLPLYPNPARNSATIPLILPENGTVAFLVEQSDGKSALKFNADLVAGYNEVSLPKGNLSEGIYFIRIRYQQTELLKKVVFY